MRSNIFQVWNIILAHIRNIFRPKCTEVSILKFNSKVPANTARTHTNTHTGARIRLSTLLRWRATAFIQIYTQPTTWPFLSPIPPTAQHEQHTAVYDRKTFSIFLTQIHERGCCGWYVMCTKYKTYSLRVNIGIGCVEWSDARHVANRTDIKYKHVWGNIQRKRITNRCVP